MLANSRILLGLVVSLSCIGCGTESSHSKAGWKAEEYFDDPKVIALCHAIERDDIDEMQAAVATGADINAIGKHGMTPLMWAFPDHKVKRFEWLLKHGADPNVCLTGDLGIGHEYFGEGGSATFLATGSAWDDYFDAVVKNGGNPNLACAGQKYSLLQQALVFGGENRFERVIALCDAGADLNDFGNATISPVMRAVSLGEYLLALELLKRGARVDAYHTGGLKQLRHFVVMQESWLHQRSDAQLQQYSHLVDWMRSHEVDIDGAKRDIARWKAWRAKPLPEQKKLREREIAERKAREAAEEKRPELAE